MLLQKLFWTIVKYYCVACLMISIQAGFYQRAEAGHQEGEELNLSRHRCHRAK